MRYAFLDIRIAKSSAFRSYLLFLFLPCRISSHSIPISISSLFRSVYQEIGYFAEHFSLVVFSHLLRQSLLSREQLFRKKSMYLVKTNCAQREQRARYFYVSFPTSFLMPGLFARHVGAQLLRTRYVI